MPVLNTGNIINLSESKLLNRGRQVSLGVACDLEKLPESERKRVMQYSMSSKQRAEAEKITHDLALLGRKVQNIVGQFPKLPDLSGFAKLQLPKLTDDFLPALRDFKTKTPAYPGYVSRYTTLPPPAPSNRDKEIADRLGIIEKELQDIKESQPRSAAPGSRTRLKLTPRSYRSEEKKLLLGNASVSFRGSRIEAGVLQILFDNKSRMKRKWDYSHFLDSNRKKLRDIGVEDWEQVRSAIDRIRSKIASESQQKKSDIFIIDNGFRINPKYLPKKQR